MPSSVVHPSPLPQRAPLPADGPLAWQAFALIILYFGLQAIFSLLFGLALAVIVAVEHGHVPDHLTAAIQSALQRPGMPAVLVIFTLCASAAIVAAIVHRRWPRLWSQPQMPGLGFCWPTRHYWFAFAVLLGLAAPLAGSWITQLLAHGHKLTQAIAELGQDTPLGLRIALVVVVISVGPVIEELLFRGVLLSALVRRWGNGWAVIVSSLVFALAHLPGLQYQWFGLPDLLLLALGLAVLRLRSGSIWPSALAHALNNLLAVAAWFVVVKPA